jgi:hypothetical protein
VSHIEQFDSIGEFLTRIAEPRYRKHRSDWGHSHDSALSAAREGNPSCNDEIASLVDKVSVELPSTQDQWVADIAGACPIVPMAIAGLPDNMLRLEQVETSGVPLRIFVSVCLSAGCNERVVRKRGIAINALLQSVSARRPVELMIFGDMGGHGYIVTPVIRVQAMPLDQSTLTGALTDEKFMRVLMFAYAHEHHRWTGQWAWGTEPTSKEAQRKTREALGANPDDLLVYGAFITEQDLIIRDPLAWVQEQVALTEKSATEGFQP